VAHDYSDPAHITPLLEGISGAFERAQFGLERARQGETVPLDEF
jgi:hypothetical protein